jgi:hypothetical protein
MGICVLQLSTLFHYLRNKLLSQDHFSLSLHDSKMNFIRSLVCWLPGIETR